MRATDHRLRILIDGLSAIAASPEDKEYINHNFVLAVDEVFDLEPLDWLPGLVRDGIVTQQIALAVEALYREIDEFTRGMSIAEEDAFIRDNRHPAPQWAARAREILAAMGQAPELPFKHRATR